MARRRLSDQQRARIARLQGKRLRRAAASAERSLEQGVEDTKPRHGRVIVRHGRSLLLRDTDGNEFPALFRANLGEVVCGDNVIWQDAGNGEGVVVAVKPRRSALVRPGFGGTEKAIAANLTQLVVVLAARPEPAGYLLDQYLVAAERIGVRGLVCLNKADLLGAEAQAAFVARYRLYETIGYPVVETSAKREPGVSALLDRLAGHTSILVGQSGVGKSSLINALIPHQAAAEGSLSEATGLGRHTTSAATLYTLDGGGELIDSPGVRSFRLGRIDRRELEQGFPEFRPWLGRCRFHNCAHLAEPGCALREAAAQGLIDESRLQSYRHMAAELADTP